MGEHNNPRRPVMLLTGQCGNARSGPWHAYGDTPRQLGLRETVEDPDVAFVEVHMKNGATIRYERLPE